MRLALPLGAASKKLREKQFTRHNQPRNGPENFHFAKFQPISPNDFSRKAATYYLTLLSKEENWKIPCQESSKFHIERKPAL